MNSLDVVQAYIGQELTETWVNRLFEAPFEQTATLVDQLSRAYYDWLELESARRQTNADPPTVFHCVDPYPRESSWDDWLTHFKQLLLYYPALAVPDPLAHGLWPPITYAVLMQSLGQVPEVDEDKLRATVRDGLLRLAALRPFVVSGDVVLLPATFALDYSVVQQGVRHEFAAMSETVRSEYFDRIVRETGKHEVTGHEGAEMVVGAVKAWGQICNLCVYTPVAANPLVRTILEHEYGIGTMRRTVPESEQRLAQSLLRFQVPGVKDIPLQDVLNLRAHEDAFYEWRTGFREVVDLAQRESPQDQEAFNAEIRLAAETLLTPRAEQLDERVKGSSALEQLIIPGAVAIGGGLVTYGVTGQVDVSTLAAVAVSPAAWVMDKVRRRMNRAGRNANRVREFYGYLLES